MTSTTGQQPMTPGDITRVAVVEELDVNPDGRLAVVARRVVHRGHYRTHLHLVDLGDPAHPHRSPRRAVRLTDGPVIDGHPRISPDGRLIAFLRRSADTGRTPKAGGGRTPEPPTTILVMPIAGGRTRTIAPRGTKPGFGAISEIAWSPDGSRLAMAAEIDPPRWLVGPHPPVGSTASGDTPSSRARRITRTDWRWDENGHVDRWAHLFVVDVPVGRAAPDRPRQITSGDHGVSGLAWHPDGATVAFVTDRNPEADVHPRPIVWAVDVDAGPRARRSKPWPVLDAPGGASHPAWSPDGRWLVAVGWDDPDWTDEASPGLLLAPATGPAAPCTLAPDLDRPVGNWCDTDLHGWTVSSRIGPAWLDDRTIVATVTDRGRSLPRRWTIDPDSGRPIQGPSAASRTDPGPELDLTTHALAIAPRAERGRMVVLGTLGGRAMEVMTVEFDGDRTAEPGGDGRLRTAVHTHTRFGSSWQKRFAQPTMKRLDVVGPGGPIETWVASPPDAGDAPLPTIVDIHGGPLGCWAPAPGVEVMLLTGAGYRVALPNIRGSAGYGAGWIAPQLGHWGGPDADDVHAVVDHLVDRGWADADRLGVLGLSYGGFLVNWLVGTTDRFAAAVSENGVTNQISAWANSDYGPEYCRAARLGNPFSPEGVERLWRQSPLRNVADVHTPLLLLQAEADLRCPPQDNEQFFIALRHLGREVEYVLYPDESHVYATAGRPDRRIDRMERVLDWFARHLVVD